MSFADEIAAAAADIGGQLHSEEITVMNPAAKTAGSLDTATGTRTGAGDAATFNARRATGQNNRSGGEAGSRAETAVFIADAAAVAEGQADGSTLTAETIASGATLVHGLDVWTVSGTTIEGGLVRIGCRRRA